MDIRVSGHQVDTGEALQQQVDERLSAIAEKYFSRAISAQVTFGKGPYDHSFTCDIVAHVPQGVVLKGSAGAALAPVAFEQAADRIETQLRRYKRRLKGRHAQTAHAEGAQSKIDAMILTGPNGRRYDLLHDTTLPGGPPDDTI